MRGNRKDFAESEDDAALKGELTRVEAVMQTNLHVESEVAAVMQVFKETL